MSEQTFQLSEEAKKVLADLQIPDWVLPTMAHSMDLQNQLTLSEIQKDHLSGRGPFPAEEHRLGVRSQRLRAAAWAAKAEVSGGQVNSSIGDNVEYAAIHEFGGRIVRKPFSGQVRLRTNAAGELLRQIGHGGHLAIFAKAEHKRVKTVDFQSQGFEIQMPERAPFRTGIGERMGDYGEAVSSDLVDEWARRGQS
jgi:hypothetical protein